MRLSNTNKFGDFQIPKFGVFLPVPPTKVGADSYNSLRSYMNNAGNYYFGVFDIIQETKNIHY